MISVLSAASDPNCTILLLLYTRCAPTEPARCDRDRPQTNSTRMTILANCSESPSGPRSSVALRVGGLFAILGGSAFLTLLPLLTRGKFQTFNYLGSVFAAGIILATAFVHILPDAGGFMQSTETVCQQVHSMSIYIRADAAMANPCLGFSTNYPWAHALAGASLILLLFVENTVKQQMLRSGLTVGCMCP